mmetsp:Transcript_22842/g.48588  ORF Transcript_22842/g.48588 Transcript_22842/m.48588 type:complete len:207 (+) Transcript_22842:236-856(+)
MFTVLGKRNPTHTVSSLGGPDLNLFQQGLGIGLGFLDHVEGLDDAVLDDHRKASRSVSQRDDGIVSVQLMRLRKFTIDVGQEGDLLKIVSHALGPVVVGVGVRNRIADDLVDTLGLEIVLEFLVRRVMGRRAGSGEGSGYTKYCHFLALEQGRHCYGVVVGEVRVRIVCVPWSCLLKRALRSGEIRAGRNHGVCCLAETSKTIDCC